jgi:hypothetical protein
MHRDILNSVSRLKSYRKSEFSSSLWLSVEIIDYSFPNVLEAIKCFKHIENIKETIMYATNKLNS